MEGTAILDRKAVYRKVKLAIIPFACLLYFFNGLDRGNVSFAALTMNKDLNISSLVFGTVTSVFFISYLIFQIPSNILLKRVGASKVIPIIASAWGIVTCLTFTAQNVHQLLPLSAGCL